MKITKTHRQIFQFLLVGILCYFISIALLMFFVEIFSMGVNIANLISSIITIFICYYLNAAFIFQSGKYSFTKELTAFFLFSLMGLALNVFLMFILTEYTDIWYVTLKTLVTVMVAVFNFSTRKWIVFQG